jgi:hypothetical protein
MHTFFKMICVAATLASINFAVPASVQAAGTTHTCSIPDAVYIDKIGCVVHITDPAKMGQSTDPVTGKKMVVRMDYDPNCDGKPSGFIYEVTVVRADGTVGAQGRNCD